MSKKETLPSPSAYCYSSNISPLRNFDQRIFFGSEIVKSSVGFFSPCNRDEVRWNTNLNIKFLSCRLQAKGSVCLFVCMSVWLAVSSSSLDRDWEASKHFLSVQLPYLLPLIYMPRYTSFTNEGDSLPAWVQYEHFGSIILIVSECPGGAL